MEDRPATLKRRDGSVDEEEELVSLSSEDGSEWYGYGGGEGSGD